MNRLRIVHVVHGFHLGGMEKGIASCVSRASADIDHVVVCLTTSGNAEKLLPEGIPIVELDKPPGNSIRFILRLARELRKLRPCVVHTRNWGGIDGVLAARIARMPAVLHGEHGWEMDDLRGTSRKRRLVRRSLSGGLSQITCVSLDIAKWLERDVRVRCEINQIYNGVDVDAFQPADGRPELRRELGIAEDAVVIGHVGRLVHVKNHDMLLRAFTSLAHRYPKAELLCVGGGPRMEELRQLAPARVHIVGHRDDVAQCFRACDVFALPSHNEGISNTILEAMATRLPVVATDVGGNSELVIEGTTGSLVPAGDTERFVEALRIYLDQPDLGKLRGENARDVVLQRFGISTMVSSYEEAWRESARRGGMTFLQDHPERDEQ